jgi:hypothetical protein
MKNFDVNESKELTKEDSLLILKYKTQPPENLRKNILIGRLQRYLISQGHTHPLTVDGQYGPYTDSAAAAETQRSDLNLGPELSAIIKNYRAAMSLEQAQYYVVPEEAPRSNNALRIVREEWQHERHIQGVPGEESPHSNDALRVARHTKGVPGEESPHSNDALRVAIQDQRHTKGVPTKGVPGEESPHSNGSLRVAIQDQRHTKGVPTKGVP